jgi:hypothetical protein
VAEKIWVSTMASLWHRRRDKRVWGQVHDRVCGCGFCEADVVVAIIMGMWRWWARYDCSATADGGIQLHLKEGAKSRSRGKIVKMVSIVRLWFARKGGITSIGSKPN